MALTSVRRGLVRAACLALALVGSGNKATAAPPDVNGSWVGVFENSLEFSGEDKLELTVNADKTVTGTWNGKKLDKGEVVTEKLLQWESSQLSARYCARCHIKGGGDVLVIDYTVTRRDDNGKLVVGYTGTSTLTRKK
jgi:hypothetical protein